MESIIFIQYYLPNIQKYFTELIEISDFYLNLSYFLTFSIYSGGTIFFANLTAFFSVEKVLSATFMGEGKVFPL